MRGAIHYSFRRAAHFWKTIQHFCFNAPSVHNATKHRQQRSAPAPGPPNATASAQNVLAVRPAPSSISGTSSAFPLARGAVSTGLQSDRGRDNIRGKCHVTARERRSRDRRARGARGGRQDAPRRGAGANGSNGSNGCPTTWALTGLRLAPLAPRVTLPLLRARAQLSRRAGWQDLTGEDKCLPQPQVRGNSKQRRNSEP